MKKILKVCVCGLVVVTMAAGCSKKPATQETTVAETTAEGTTGTTETTAATEMIDISGIDNGTITLGDYKGIEVTKEVVEVTDEEVDAVVQSAVDAKVEYIDVDRVVQDTDKVNIDYVGTKGGVAFDGGTATAQDLVIGSGQFIEGFESGLIGAKKGDVVTLNLTFPADYTSADLAGQAVEFKVTVNKVQEKKASVLDDAFVQANSEFKTVDEYKAGTKQTLLDRKEAQAQSKVESEILKAVVANAKIETKKEAVDANYSNFITNYTNQAAMYGTDFATLATAFYGMDEATFKTYLQGAAESAVQQRLAFQAIAEKEGIKITDEDRDGLAVEMQYENKEAMIEAAGAYTVDDYLLSTKTMKFLVDNAIIK